MTANELRTEKKYDDANLAQLYAALLGVVKIDFCKSALRERQKELMNEIKNNPACVYANHSYSVNWGYGFKIDDNRECYKLHGLLYEFHALESAISKL